MLSNYLRDKGYTVTTCSSGRKAINRVKNESPDLVLIDIRMIGLSGVDTIKQIERICRKTQFIIITGYAITEDVASLLEQNKRVHGYLFKPFDLNELLSRIKNIL